MAHQKKSKQFREQACRLVNEEGYTAAEAARSLGIAAHSLRYWLRSRGPADQPRANQGDPPARGNAAAGGPPDPRALQIQVRELEARIRRLEMEKDILKKATAYFASHHL